jgi:hypothetical protein
MPHNVGYSFALSDVRVTLANGTEFDCLQKNHPVGQFVAAGFAGSIQIAFAMLDTLSELLHTTVPTQAWIPEAVSQWWPRMLDESLPCSLSKACSTESFTHDRDPSD